MQAEEIKTKELNVDMKTNENKAQNSQPSQEKYTHDEAMKSSVEYFNGDELAATVWINKYALKDSFGNLFEKNPDQMHRRLAKEIARVKRSTQIHFLRVRFTMC